MIIVCIKIKMKLFENKNQGGRHGNRIHWQPLFSIATIINSHKIYHLFKRSLFIGQDFSQFTLLSFLSFFTFTREPSSNSIRRKNKVTRVQGQTEVFEDTKKTSPNRSKVRKDQKQKKQFKSTITLAHLRPYSQPSRPSYPNHPNKHNVQSSRAPIIKLIMLKVINLYWWVGLKVASRVPLWIPSYHLACGAQVVACWLPLAADQHGLKVGCRYHGPHYGCYCGGTAPVHAPFLHGSAPCRALPCHPCHWNSPRPVHDEP